MSSSATKINRLLMMRTFLLGSTSMLFAASVLVRSASAFAVIPFGIDPNRRHSQRPSTSSGRPSRLAGGGRSFLSSSSTELLLANPRTSNNSNKSNADFEYQELRIILDAMQRQGITDLASPGKENLEDFARTVARDRSSSSTSQLSFALDPNELVGSIWRLAYSNDLSNLPPDATVYLQFHSTSNMTYKLKFGDRTLGLNAIAADCPWQVGNNGALTFVYDKVSMDAFGFQNIGMGLFGMLQGRSQTIYTAYFDGEYWIDLGADDGGSVTIYVKEKDCLEQQKRQTRIRANDK